MAYGLPVRGQRDWDDEVNNSVEALHSEAQVATAAAEQARSNATSAITIAQDAAAKVDAFRSIPDAATASLVTDGPLTSAALSDTLASKWRAATAYVAGDVRQAPDGSTIRRNTNGTSAATFTTTELAAPVLSAPTTATTGGTIAAGTTYFYKATALNALGETIGSTEVSRAIAAALTTPVNAAFTTATTGGTLAAGTYSYRVSATNAAGETLASTATTQTVAAALAAPVLAAPTTATTGGTLAAATYYYKATAINAVGETIGSNEVSIATTGTTSTVGLSWAAITGATGYKIYRATVAGGESTSPALVATLDAVTTYTDTGTAVSAGAVPATNTTATTTNTVTVNWGAVAGATGYKVYGRTDAGELLMASVGAVTTWTDTGAVTPAGALPASNTTATNTNTVGLSWAAITGATGYKIYRATATGGQSTSPALVASVGAVTTYTDTGTAVTAGAVPATGTTSEKGHWTAVAAVAGTMERVALSATIDAAIADAEIPDPSLVPLYISTTETAGSQNAAPGVRTGLATTTHSVTAGDGVVAAQGYTTEHVATGVSGTEGEYTLTVTDTTTLATLDDAGSTIWDAAVDDGSGNAFTVTVLDVVGGTVTVMNPLPRDVTGGTLASRVDAVSGQHLTSLAYKALAQHIAGFNPSVGSRGGMVEGVNDLTPATARVLWAKNAASTAYGAVTVNNIASSLFDQGTANITDSNNTYKRPTTVSGGSRIGVHLAGHGGTATLRTGRRRVVLSVSTAADAPGAMVAATARIKVTATTPDGIVLYDETVGGGLHTHRIHIPAGFDSVTVEATHQGGAEYYLQLSHVSVREAGAGTRLAPRKALVLGDSWTQYYGKVLGTHLAAALGCKVATFGKGGTTTDWGIAWLDYALEANPGCDTVILHFYTNDLNNNQSTTMSLPDGTTGVSMWPNGLTAAQAEARWVTQVKKLVAMIAQRGLRPVVVLPGSVVASKQVPAAVHAETPHLIEWAAASGEFTEDTSYLNTIGKRAGVDALDTTLGKPLWASGATGVSTWKDATGTVAHTPA